MCPNALQCCVEAGLKNVSRADQTVWKYPKPKVIVDALSSSTTDDDFDQFDKPGAERSWRRRAGDDDWDR